MEDVAPKLWEELRAEFQRLYNDNEKIQRFLSQAEKGIAVSADAAKYAESVGECAAAAMESVLALDRLPNETMYFNIAERTVRPLFELIHKLVNDAAMATMEAENEKEKIGLKPIRGSYPKYRIKGYIDRLIELSVSEE